EHYGNEYYQGELLLLQTNETELNFLPYTKWYEWSDMSLVFDLAHYHYYYEPRPKYVPIKDGFALMAPGWRESGEYVTIDPIWDGWFTEKVVYNTSSGEVTYYLNGQKVGSVRAVPLNSNYIRIMMHSYGWYTGHYMKLDWVRIEVQPGGSSTGISTGTSTETQTETSTTSPSSGSGTSDLEYLIENGFEAKGVTFSSSGYSFKGDRARSKAWQALLLPLRRRELRLPPLEELPSQDLSRGIATISMVIGTIPSLTAFTRLSCRMNQRPSTQSPTAIM
ncbi:hypothetical protein, partial [Thermococcus sp.]